MTLLLHYAPDNASLCVRLALETLGLPYRTTLVDRSRAAQREPAYRALAPTGLIPTLETPDGPIFETAAILLWLADRAPSEAFPGPEDPSRGIALSWLAWLSNTLHATMRVAFYPDRLPPVPSEPMRTAAQRAVRDHLSLLEPHAQSLRPLHWCYLGPMLRWAVLYHGAPPEFALSDIPNLARRAATFEATPAVAAAALAEGLGPTPFTAPRPARPPEGSPT